MAVAEVPRVKVEKVGLSPFREFDEANQTWPRGDRPAAIREAASEFRARFATPENRVRAVRTVDIASAGYPLKFAFGGAAKGAEPVRQHHQPAPGDPVRGLRRAAAGRSPTSRRSRRGLPRRRTTRSRSRSSASSSHTRCWPRSGTTRTRRWPRSGCAPRTSTTSASTTCTSRTCGSCSGPPSRFRARRRRARRCSRTRS